MKFGRLIVALLTAFLFAHSARAQGTFQNLNFEEANPLFVDPPVDTSVTTASALPFWSAAIGGVQQTDVGYNFLSTGAPYVSLIGPGSSYPAIDGNYSVLLIGTGVTASISQTGLVPSGTQSLLFEAAPGQGALNIMVGTQDVPFSAIGTGPNYTLYGANVSAWANDSEALTFSAQEFSGINDWMIDDISFSPQTVPEPSPLALTGVGGLLFALYRRFASKRG